jgi:hypothetical protein
VGLVLLPWLGVMTVATVSTMQHYGVDLLLSFPLTFVVVWGVNRLLLIERRRSQGLDDFFKPIDMLKDDFAQCLRFLGLKTRE